MKTTASDHLTALRRKWILALESGKYHQCRGVLRYGDSFCALGVLCDVDDPSGWYHPEGDIADSYYRALDRSVYTRYPNLPKIFGTASTKLPAFAYRVTNPYVVDNCGYTIIPPAYTRSLYGVTDELLLHIEAMNDYHMPFATIAQRLRTEFGITR